MDACTIYRIVCVCYNYCLGISGEKAFEYLAGNSRRTGWYRLCYGMFAFFGAVCSLEAVWDFSDICNGLMAVPNLLAVVMLSQESAGK